MTGQPQLRRHPQSDRVTLEILLYKINGTEMQKPAAVAEVLDRDFSPSLGTLQNIS
jgi:hypothetical protein